MDMIDRYKVRSAIMLVCCLMLWSCKIPLFEEIPERDANEIMSVLFANQIPSEKIVIKPGIVSIHIDEERFADAVQLLKMHGLPKTGHQSFGDIFKKEGLLSTPLEERARYLFARSQEIAATIEHIDGVLECWVNVVLPEEKKSGKSTLQQGTASVLIRFDDRHRLADLVPQIKRLVASSIEAVPYENVTLLMLPVDLSIETVGVSPTTAAPSEEKLLTPVVLAAMGISVVAVMLLTALAVWICLRTGRLTWADGKPARTLDGELAGAVGDAVQ